MTPLAESIRQAMDDFVFDPARINSIVMLSDGIETCGGDPCGLVEELKAQGINFTMHVIGLDVDEPTREQLMCIAGAGEGTYHDAQSEQELDQALEKIQEELVEKEVVVPPAWTRPPPPPRQRRRRPLHRWVLPRCRPEPPCRPRSPLCPRHRPPKL